MLDGATSRTPGAGQPGTNEDPGRTTDEQNLQDSVLQLVRNFFGILLLQVQENIFLYYHSTAKSIPVMCGFQT